MSTATTPFDGSVRSDVQYFYSCEDSTLTDTIAAVVSAIMAVVFVVLIVCIVQAIKKRRQQQQSNRHRQPIVHTVAPGVFHSGKHCENLLCKLHVHIMLLIPKLLSGIFLSFL